ncbi:MAG: hypothetical protein HUU35_09920 [Armatimonadetes bacterium]|nr:hypothetical protein [Armatimonadota bacterium]
MTERRFWLPLLALVGLCRLSAGLELALIPPVGDERVAAAIRSAAAEVGISVATLEPAQVIDPARFSAAVYGLAVLVGGERYPDTVIEEGDAAAALERYVEGGGALLVTGAGPVFSRPQRWSGSEWRTSPAPVRRAHP